jgi:hypothetical protein
MVCYSILWITGVWKWRIVGGGEDRRYINKKKASFELLASGYF